MAQGNANIQKIVKKASYWHSHGTHSVDPGVLARERREKIKKPAPEMFNTVREAFDSIKKRTR